MATEKRRPGRPTLYDEPSKTACISIPASLLERIDVEADREGLSRSSAIVRRLRAAYASSITPAA